MIIRRTPKVRFFSSTRSWREPAIREVLAEMAAEPNLQLWYSADRDTRLTRDRLQQLSVTLRSLRERVRDAVASEMGKAVGEALRDLVTAMLTRQPIPVVSVMETQRAPPAPSSGSRWDDHAEQDWDDDPPASSPPKVEPDHHVTVPTVDAVKLGVGLTTWLVHRKVPLLAGLGLGLAAGLATLSNHPIVQTGLAVVAAASELLAITEYALQSTSPEKSPLHMR